MAQTKSQSTSVNLDPKRERIILAHHLQPVSHSKTGYTGVTYRGKIPVKLVRGLLALDEKDHFILRDEFGLIWADTTDEKIAKRTRWVVENKLEQYWEAELTYNIKTKRKQVKLLKRIKNLGWDDYADVETEITKGKKSKNGTKS